MTKDSILVINIPEQIKVPNLVSTLTTNPRPEPKSKLKYQGILKDRCGILNERRTRYYETYYDAHQAAEKLCRKSWGNRGTIDVIPITTERRK